MPSLKNRKTKKKRSRRRIPRRTNGLNRAILFPPISCRATRRLLEAAHAPTDASAPLPPMFDTGSDLIRGCGHCPEVWRGARFALRTRARLAARRFRAEQPNLERLRLD